MKGMLFMDNPYKPYPVTIQKITPENDSGDIKTFDLVFHHDKDMARFRYVCGQFAQISLLGVGESPIGIASNPMDKDMIQFTVKRYMRGVVTTALHSKNVGDTIGVRGPYGNGFPMDYFEGRNVVIIGGGFAFTTLRSLANFILHDQNRSRFGELFVMVAVRNPGELIYKYDLKAWNKRSDIQLVRTVDAAEGDWDGRIGFAAPVLKEVAPSSSNAVAIICGPPIMIKTCLPVIEELGFKPENIFNSLEKIGRAHV